MTDPMTAQEVFDNWDSYLRPVDRLDFLKQLQRIAPPEVAPTLTELAMKEAPTLGEAVRRNLRMAMDSREFYELSQAYRHAGLIDPAGTVEAWDALKQYILDNALPSSQPQSRESK